MISEKQLSAGYPSLWQRFTPLEDALCKKIARLEHAVPALVESSVQPSRRALTSELGYELLCKWIATDDVQQILVNDEIERVRNYVSRLSHGAVIAQPNREELEEAALIAKLVKHRADWLCSIDSAPIPKPEFMGCGVLAKCYGDLICGSTLVEIKAVSRAFSPQDLRQVFIYAFLNWMSSQYEIGSVELLNPRRGAYYQLPLRAFCQQLTGRSPVEVFAELADVVTAEEFWFH